jgi:hypothetical protein
VNGFPALVFGRALLVTPARTQVCRRSA